MSSGHDDTTHENFTTDVPADDIAHPDKSASVTADEELTGQADLDEKLAKPVFEGTTGIEAAQVWIGAFLVVVVALIAYSNSLSIPMVYTDRVAIAQNPGAQSVVMAAMGSKNAGVALVPMVTIALTWMTAPGSMALLHAINLALHALNGVLVYLLARRLLGLNRKPDDERQGSRLSEPIAMLGGFLFALHPLATESVNLAIGRAPLLCTAFSIAAVLLFLRGADRNGGFGIGALIGSGICFALAWTCGTVALLIPAFLLVADWTANGKRVLKHLPVHAIFWGIAIAFGVWWITVLGLQRNPYSIYDPTTIVPPPVEAASYWRGLSLSVNPTSLSIDHDLPPASGYIDPEEPGANVYVTATTAIGFGLVALILIVVRSPAGLGLAWLLLALVPVAYYIPPITQFNERSLYFALCGPALLLPWAVSTVAKKKNIALVAGLATAALLLAAATGTYLRNDLWHDERQLWEDATLKSPDAPGPVIRLGTMHYDAAQRAFAQSDRLARDNQRPAAMEKREEAQREFGAALNYLQQAVDLKPHDAPIRAMLGSVMHVLNRREDAIAMLTEALRIDPRSQECMAELATIYAVNPDDPVNTDGKERALDYFERAARIGPLAPRMAIGYADLLARIGNVLGAAQVLVPYASSEGPKSLPAAVLQQVGPVAQVARDADQKAAAAERNKPGKPDTIKLRIKALLANGETLSAFYQLERFLQLYPGDTEAWLELGVTRARVGEQDAFVKERPTAPAGTAGNMPIWLQLARQCGELGRWAAARAYLEHAATLSEVYSDPLLKLARLALDLKQPPVAAALLEEAAKAAPHDPAPWLLLCDIAIDSKNLPQARAYLDEAERLGAAPADVTPRRKKAGITPEAEKRKSRSVLQ